MATIPEITDRLEAATEKAENASQIIYDVANGDASTEVPTASGPTPTLKKWFQDLGSAVGPMLAGIPERLDKAVLTYPDYAAAVVAAASLPDGQLIDASVEQKRYRVDDGSLVFVENYLRSDLLNPSEGAGLISILPTGLGATVRSLKKEIDLRSGVRMLDFSALESRDPGITDDSEAAMKAVSVLELRGGGTLILPDGDVRFNSSIIIDASDIIVAGGGNTRVINGTENSPAIDFIGTSEMRWRCGISSVLFAQATDVISVDGNCGYRAKNQGSFTERDVYVYEYPSRLHRGIMWLRVVAGAFSNRDIQGCKASGAYFGEICNDIYFENFRTDANGGSGVEWRDVQGVFGTNGTAYYNDVFGWDLGTAGGYDNKNFFLVNCFGDTNGTDNWHITQLATGKFVNCWGSTQKNTIDFPTAVGWFLDGDYVKNITLIGGDALFNNGHGIYANKVDNLEIVGFSGGIDGNGNGQSIEASGLWVGPDARDVRVNGGSYLGNSDQGIRISAGALDTQVLGASLRNNIVGQLYNGSDSSTIRSCPGYNPQMGSIVTPDIPAAGVNVKNSTGSDVTVYISSGSVSAIFLDGSYVANQSPATIRLPAGESISMNYSSAPVWKWIGE